MVNNCHLVKMMTITFPIELPGNSFSFIAIFWQLCRPQPLKSEETTDETVALQNKLMFNTIPASYSA